jgi:hypothetical protein
LYHRETDGHGELTVSTGNSRWLRHVALRNEHWIDHRRELLDRKNGVDRLINRALTERVASAWA